MSELATKYVPGEVEDKWYAYWLNHNLFHSTPDAREPYTVVIPPPNVTGVLHMGHMLNNTIQDILVRRARMEGKNALWVPGTDHASISTETKVIGKLKEMGIKKTDITREEFLRHAWEWTDKYGGIILQQLRKLGASCDWERTAFTMDEKRSSSVIKVFCDLYDKGLIYRGLRMVNWDPENRTAISDDEVFYVEEKAKLYYLRYYIADDDMSGEMTDESVVHTDSAGRRYAVVATTRPETIMGDTAMCINPKDPKNTWLKGKKVIVPLVGRVIPVIEDRYVEIDFGTGCLKVTPAHDKNDYMLGKTHNLDTIDIFNEDGTVSEESPLYVGMDRFAVREQIAKDLEAAGLMEKIEDYVNNIGLSERTKVPIEPRLSLQWFIKMKHFAEISLGPVMDDIIRFVPEKYKTTYRLWLENIQDWCISRQLWWGHRIPAYFYGEPEAQTFVVAENVEQALEKARAASGNPDLKAEDLHQDEGALDTWFSSWLWPITLFDGINNPGNEEIKYYYPTATLVTGPDIIFFWVARMVCMAMAEMGEVPFHTVYIHGLIRDAQGRKMSKSLGNGIDPLEIVEKYGADALRFTLCTGNSPGNDSRFSDEKVSASRNFCNKIWNASRYVQMNLTIEQGGLPERLTLEDKWILSRYNTLVKEVTENLDKFELGVAADKLYSFIWDLYCDWYIELTKPRLQNREDAQAHEGAQRVLAYVLSGVMQLLHPFMPFITETIWQALPRQNGEEAVSVSRSRWPEYKEELRFEQEERQMDKLMEAIRAIRNRRSEMNVPPSKKAKLMFAGENTQLFLDAAPLLERLAYGSQVTAVEPGEDLNGAVSVVTGHATVYIPMNELVDMEKEKARLTAEKEKAEQNLQRILNKLANESFVAKAPAAVVEAEREKAEKAKSLIAKLEENLKGM